MFVLCPLLMGVEKCMEKERGGERRMREGGDERGKEMARGLIKLLWK